MWNGRKVKGVLLDITGVLAESGAGERIKGSVKAVQALKDNGENESNIISVINLIIFIAFQAFMSDL